MFGRSASKKWCFFVHDYCDQLVKIRLGGSHGVASVLSSTFQVH